MGEEAVVASEGVEESEGSFKAFEAPNKVLEASFKVFEASVEESEGVEECEVSFKVLEACKVFEAAKALEG